MTTYLLVAAGGAVGAVARYLLDRAVQSRHAGVFPLGTLAANLVGSLLLGGLVGAGDRVGQAWALLLGSGVCGALTTYSTFAFESWRLAEERRAGVAAANAIGTVVLCVAAAASGFVLVRGVVGAAG